MRLRFLVIPILALFCVIAVYNVCHEDGGAVDTVVGVARRITYGALFAIGFCSASLVLRKWMGHQPTRPATPVAPAPPVPTFAMPARNAAEGLDGPGKYRVSGVDHDTRFEISEIVYAESPTKAKLKVELKGVEVGMVERAG